MAVKRVRMSTCASDGTTGFGLGRRQNKQSNHQTMMKKGWNRWSTQKTKGMWDAPRKVEWTCLGLHAFGYGESTCWGLYGMAMERSCSLWRRREFWDHSVPPNTTRSTRLSLCGCDLTTSISSLRTSYGNKGESAQTDDCTGIHPRSTPQKPMFRTSSRARGFIRGWIQTAWRMDALPKKSHQRSQSTGCVLVRKAPTTLTQSGNSTVDSTQSGNSQTSAPQVKDRGGLQG